MRLSQLPPYLDNLLGFKNPQSILEQWRTPGKIAAELINMANVSGKAVLDLGCGAGVLSIAAKLMGAKKVVGVDLDEVALDIARQNSNKLKLDIKWVHDNALSYTPTEKFDTVIMNPPYGSVVRGIDRKFIEASLKLAPEVFVIVSSYSRKFFEENYQAQFLKTFKFPLKNQQSFHKKSTKNLEVNLLKFTPNKLQA